MRRARSSRSFRRRPAAADLRARRRFDGRDLGLPARYVLRATHSARPSSCAATVREKPDPDPSSITREGFADDVLAVADALGAERFTIVGCSLGGVVAFELWRRVPRRIAGMVLLGTFARYPDGEVNARQISAAVLEAGDMRAFGRIRAEKLGMPPDRMRETVEQMACKSVDCYLASTQATWTGDYRDVLGAIDVPALVAYGEHDVVAPRSLAQDCLWNQRRALGDGRGGRARCQRRQSPGLQPAAARVSRNYSVTRCGAL